MIKILSREVDPDDVEKDEYETIITVNGDRIHGIHTVSEVDDRGDPVFLSFTNKSKLSDEAARSLCWWPPNAEETEYASKEAFTAAMIKAGWLEDRTEELAVAIFG